MKTIPRQNNAFQIFASWEKPTGENRPVIVIRNRGVFRIPALELVLIYEGREVAFRRLVIDPLYRTDLLPSETAQFTPMDIDPAELHSIGASASADALAFSIRSAGVEIECCRLPWIASFLEG